MSLSKRAQLYISPEQWRAVEAEAKRRGVSAAEIVRAALSAHCPPKPSLSDVLPAVAGAWAHLETVGPDHIAALRGEWASRPHA